jgi:hypothetical protein
MSRKQPASRVEAVVASFKRKYEALPTDDERVEVEGLLLDAPWFGLLIKTQLYAQEVHAAEAVRAWKRRDMNRSRKPDPEIEQRNINLAIEKQKKTWTQMKVAHPEMPLTTLRSAVKEGMRLSETRMRGTDKNS